MQSGWILDVSPVTEGMCVWIVDAEGNARSYVDPWAPYFCLKAGAGFDVPLRRLLKSFHTPVDIAPVQKKEFFTGKFLDVIRVSIASPLTFSSIVKQLQTVPDIELFDADVPLGQRYFYERQLFPLAKCSFESDETGRIVRWELNDSPWELIYELPPLRYAHLEMEFPAGSDVWVNPSHRRRGRFVLTLGQSREQGRSYAFDASEEELILSLNRRIADWDPDVLLTEGGDDYLFPRLQFYAHRTGIPLLLSRNSRDIGIARPARSFMTYGKLVYQAASRTLFGRLHIDRRNSFTVGHTGLHGLFEMARVAKIPIQRAARCTIGTSLSSMQHEWAVKHDVLVPLDKGQTEDFRSAEDLIASDRGGLVYEPELGFHEDVIEFDFASMYPEVMVRHNITPEAVNCPCCPDNGVPGLNHHLCRTRGMVPDVLEPIVRKRAIYKQMIKAKHPDSVALKERYDAFKWALVTCFGYLGFRNARFGRIEAHECVNAYGREALLHAKEIAEGAGFHFLHAIVDSLWLKKDPFFGVSASDEEIENLRRKIEEATGLPMALEGRYRWIRFCESKQKKGRGVPNRYFGAFTTGNLKFRGIELRRHDTPLLIKVFQQELLDLMATARNKVELEALVPRLEEIRSIYDERIREGRVTPMEVAISKQLRHAPSEYVHDTLSALAAKKMEAAGIKLHPGETISYVVTEEKDKVKDWRVMPLALIEDTFEIDVRYYRRLLANAFETLLVAF